MRQIRNGSIVRNHDWNTLELSINIVTDLVAEVGLARHFVLTFRFRGGDSISLMLAARLLTTLECNEQTIRAL